MAMRARVSDYIFGLQETIVAKLETYSSGQNFRREPWTDERGGGGGLSCTLSSDGAAIEKAGVNVTTMSGVLSPDAVASTDSYASLAPENIDAPLAFFITGLSLIVHPRHPRIPSVHANYRYTEIAHPHEPNTVLASSFGLVTDLTPAYPDPTDFVHFHTTLRTACDTWTDAAHTDLSVYPHFKASCDAYFYIPHRNEHRGIGGVRFNDMGADAMRALLVRVAEGWDVPEDTIARLSTPEAIFGLVTSLGDSFLPSFVPILERRMNDPVVPRERRWQLLRRGRAVEFNLVVDRGTKFGLGAPGINPENVLVGMPPEARWEYCSELGQDQDSEEAEMMRILEEPRNWVV